MLSKQRTLSLIVVFLCFFRVSPFNMKEAIKRANNFEMSAVIERYKKDYNVSDIEAALHEKELKKYLVLCVRHNVSMFSQEVDNLWHTFIIYTKEYADFCRRVAGKFLHHRPFSKKDRLTRNILEEKAKFEESYKATFKQDPPKDVWKQLDECCGRCSSGNDQCGGCDGGDGCGCGG